LAAEWDKYANKAYGLLYGDDHLTTDVTKIDESKVPDHDVMVFGMPCQAFSVAGKRLGFDDMRGTLYFEALRIAREKKPKVLWMENVKGLVGHDSGRTLEIMAQAMCDIGYTIDFEVLNSKYFGVPQNRERIFMIGVRDDLIKTSKWSTGKRTDVVAKGKRRIAQLDGVKTFNFDWPSQNEVTVRLRDILEDNVDERYYLSEDKTAKLVAQLNEQSNDVPRLVGGIGDINFGNQFRQGNRVYDSEAIAMCLNAQPVGNAGGNSYLYTVNEFEEVNTIMLGHIDLKGHDAIKRVYDPSGVSPTLTTMGGGPREPKIAEVKALGNTNPSGNGMNGQVYDIDAGLAPTLTTNKGEGTKIAGLEADCMCGGTGKVTEYQNWDGSERLSPIEVDCYECDGGNDAQSTYCIRKLTPLECFRLQGFPDEFHAKLTAANVSNSQLYKMCGNAVTVNVIEAIGERLIPLLEVDRTGNGLTA
jgi:DNA (cytosine-5)-methyltransferase 1